MLAARSLTSTENINRTNLFNMKKTSITLAAATVLGFSLISTNADAQWGKPKHHGGHHSAHNSSLQKDIAKLDRMGNEMVIEFSRQMDRRNHHSANFMNLLKSNSRLTRNLVNISNSSNNYGIGNAARDVDNSMRNIMYSSRRIHLSSSMKSTIKSSSELAQRVSKSALSAKPSRPSYSNHSTNPKGGSYRGSHSNGNSNRGATTNSRGGWASLIHAVVSSRNTSNSKPAATTTSTTTSKPATTTRPTTTSNTRPTSNTTTNNDRTNNNRTDNDRTNNDRTNNDRTNNDRTNNDRQTSGRGNGDRNGGDRPSRS